MTNSPTVEADGGPFANADEAYAWCQKVYEETGGVAPALRKAYEFYLANVKDDVSQTQTEERELALEAAAKIADESIIDLENIVGGLPKHSMFRALVSDIAHNIRALKSQPPIAPEVLNGMPIAPIPLKHFDQKE